MQPKIKKTSLKDLHLKIDLLKPMMSLENHGLRMNQIIKTKLPSFKHNKIKTKS